jgi:hypothetical protein
MTTTPAGAAIVLQLDIAIGDLKESNSDSYPKELAKLGGERVFLKKKNFRYRRIFKQESDLSTGPKPVGIRST